MKCAKQLKLLVLILAVYSVSFYSTAYAYPVSKSNFSEPLESDRPSPPSNVIDNSSDEPSSARSQTTSRRRSAPVSPLAPGTHNLSVGVGQIFLTGDLTDNFENALGTQVHYTYGVSDMFSFESDFGYSSHNATAAQGSFSLMNIDAALRTNLIYFDQLIPFASVGLGFYRPSATLSNNATLSALLFGMQLGGGVDLIVSRQVFIGTRLAYHNMFDSTKKASDGVIRDVGGSFISFMIHAGVTF